MKYFLIKLLLFNCKLNKINFHKILSEKLSHVIKFSHQWVEYDANK